MPITNFVSKGKMNKVISYCAAAVVLSSTAACTSVRDRANLVDGGALSGQPMSIVARPVEYAIAEIGDASGEATSTTILGLFHMGDDPGQQFSILGNKSNQGLEGVAAYRAAVSKGGDAFYQVFSHTTSTGIPLLWSTKTTKVEGKALKMKHIGTVSEERSDRIREALHK